MEKMNEWKDLTLESFKSMGNNIGTVVPNLLGALMILLGGWLITKLVLVILKKFLLLTKVDRFTEKVGAMDIFGNNEVKFKISAVILSFVKWIMLLGFMIVAADIMSWAIVSSEIGNLLRYLPKLFSAIVLFGIGLYIANFIKKTILGVFGSFQLAGARIIGTAVFYIIMVFMAVTALNQAGIDTTIITNNITIILGSVLLALSIGFGLGSKDVIADLLKTFYARKNYAPGDRIRFNDIEGVIETIDNISMTLRTEKGKTVIPIKEITGNTIEVLS